MTSFNTIEGVAKVPAFHTTDDERLEERIEGWERYLASKEYAEHPLPPRELEITEKWVLAGETPRDDEYVH